MHTNQKMAQSMAKTTTTMSKINKQMDVKKMAKTMQNFEKENMKMEMTEEMMNDAMGKSQFQTGSGGHCPTTFLYQFVRLIFYFRECVC